MFLILFISESNMADTAVEQKAELGESLSEETTSKKVKKTKKKKVAADGTEGADGTESKAKTKTKSKSKCKHCGPRFATFLCVYVV